jgi:hypothetical protein
VAHLPAYKSIVEENINDLRKEVPTRAIYQDMMVKNSIKVIPSVGIFDNGGWGL